MNNNHEQRALPLVGEVPAPQLVPMELIRRQESKEDAIRLCWDWRLNKKVLTQTYAAECMNISKAQFSKLLNGQSGFRGNQERVFQFICMNFAINQWLAWESGFVLVDETWEAHNARRAVGNTRRSSDRQEAA